MFKYIFILVLLFTTAFAQDYKKIMKEGDDLYSKFNNKGALTKYQEAFKLAPDDFDVNFKLTRAYNSFGEELFEKGNKSQAEQTVAKAIEQAEIFHKKFPKAAESYAYLAVSYGNSALFKGGKEKIKLSKKVEENAKAANKANPNYYLPYVILGKFNYEIANLSFVERTFANTFLGKVPEGSFEESERLLKKGIQIEPNLIILHYYLSRTYEELDKEKEERAELNKVLSLPEREFRDKGFKQKAKDRLEDM